MPDLGGSVDYAAHQNDPCARGHDGRAWPRRSTDTAHLAGWLPKARTAAQRFWLAPPHDGRTTVVIAGWLTEPLTAQRLCRAESAPRLAVVAAASGAIEVPRVIADDARLGERGVRRRYARCPRQIRSLPNRHTGPWTFLSRLRWMTRFWPCFRDEMGSRRGLRCPTAAP